MDPNAVKAPQSMEEVERLIQRLYEPGTPKIISQIDDQLKLIQHSPEGWQVADALLASQDESVRFFAVLTFQIKLNNDGSKLDAATAQSVLMRLISWTVRLDRAGEKQMVRKKLCAALGTFFLQSPVPWEQPLVHLALSFVHGDAVPSGQVPAAHDTINNVLPRLNESQVVTLLWLTAQLATDGNKADSSNPASSRIHAQMIEMAETAGIIMQYAIHQENDEAHLKGKAEALVCFVNWVNYAQPIWTPKPEALAHLRNIVPGLTTLLTVPSLQNEAMDAFRDILESYTSLFEGHHMHMLSSIISTDLRPRMLQALQDLEPEVLPVAQFVIAYGIANVQELVQEPEVEQTSGIPLSLILAILQAPGYPGDEDEVSLHSIEFWNTYIEFINEVTYSDVGLKTNEPWVAAAQSTCMTLTTLLWQKMRTPDIETAREWTDAESEGFKEFRMDASDLMLSLYVFLGVEMLQHLITIALNALKAQQWQDLEAALFCLNNVADNVLEDSNAENTLLQVFRSPLFRIVGDFSQDMPTQTRRTAVDTLGSYGGYIERHAEFLPDTLRFLFASLENPGLYLSAAKSIASLCSTCRSSLTGELDGFLQQYMRFAQSETSEPYTNEKVIGAIAVIIQAVKPDSAKAQPLSALLDIVDGMVVNARQYTDPDMVEVVGVSAIECLGTIGKKLQAPEDVPIDLYEDSAASTNRDSYWLTAEGQAIQQRILTICQSVIQVLPHSGSAIDGVCQVLKSGFAETEPGPFVFPPAYTVAFLEQCSAKTPNVEAVLAMTCTLITHYSRKDQPTIDAEVQRIFITVANILQELVDPSQDPGVAHSCIDVFNRMTKQYLHILLDTAGTGDMVRLVLDFAAKALDGTELLPKRSAADFWAKIISPLVVPSDETVRTRSEQVIAAYGPLLGKALMNQIAGRGQRSELEQLCEPLKALLSTRRESKVWLEQALQAIQPTNANVDDAEKRRFVAGLTATRGDIRRTRDLVRHFYAACRGTVASYA